MTRSFDTSKEGAERSASTEPVITTRPIWFASSEDHELFGWLHVPASIKGAVVLSRPVGIEALLAHRAYRLIADKLARRGILTFRFDYFATGDSAGKVDDVVSVTQWTAGIEAAISYVHDIGINDIGIVGLRLGANLMATVANKHDLRAAVVWDPCVSGRRFLRGQTLLARMHQAPGSSLEAPTGKEIPGMLLRDELASEIALLEFAEAGRARLADEVLILTRAEVSAEVRERFDSNSVTWGSAPDQVPFMDAEVGDQVIPGGTVDEIVSWLDGRFHAETVPSEGLVPTDSAQATLADGVCEQAVEVGPVGLFGIVSEHESVKGRDAPIVVLLNSGRIPHTGPGRLWVDLARSWARSGLRVARFDLSGLGDSRVRNGQKAEVAFPHEAMEDLRAITSFLSPDDPSRVILVGSCSGAYHAVEAGLHLRSRGVLVVNPPFVSPLPENFMTGGETSWREAGQRPSALAQMMLRHPVVVRLASEMTPGWMWWLLDRIGIYALPSRSIESLIDQGTDTLLLLAVDDAKGFIGRARGTLRRLARTGRLRYEVIEEMDHALFDYTARQTVSGVFHEHLRTKFAPFLGRPTPDVVGRRTHVNVNQ